jgi:hypothetical protein
VDASYWSCARSWKVAIYLWIGVRFRFSMSDVLINEFLVIRGQWDVVGVGV